MVRFDHTALGEVSMVGKKGSNKRGGGTAKESATAAKEVQEESRLPATIRSAEVFSVVDLAVQRVWMVAIFVASGGIVTNAYRRSTKRHGPNALSRTLLLFSFYGSLTVSGCHRHFKSPHMVVRVSRDAQIRSQGSLHTSTASSSKPPAFCASALAACN